MGYSSNARGAAAERDRDSDARIWAIQADGGRLQVRAGVADFDLQHRHELEILFLYKKLPELKIIILFYTKNS